MKLDEYLAAKPLYYEKIDYDRFPRIYNQIKEYFRLPKIIHVVGTNAKGSTGRALAHLLHAKGLSVGHYSSPHIINFNERIWLNGQDSSNKTLEIAHLKLQKILNIESAESLSYFEYTTLLAMLIFCEVCDYIVLEAGLGGEFDATNVFAKNLSIVTPVGYDHQLFLGNSIEEIATTKLRSVNNDMVLAKQHEAVLYELAYNRIDEVKRNLYLAQSYLPDDFYHEITEFVKDEKLAPFFKDNLATAFCAYQLLGFELDIKLLSGLIFFGRCYKITSNITIDVGHNPMAASALLEHFKDKKVILIYNSYNDKEYERILSILKPIILEVQIIKLSNNRAVEESVLINSLDLLDIKHSNFIAIEQNLEYLVFGSFSVVETFLKENSSEK
jgi:dihydrofolate synthase/folylpolyglutamate synthase